MVAQILLASQDGGLVEAVSSGRRRWRRFQGRRSSDRRIDLTWAMKGPLAWPVVRGRFHFADHNVYHVQAPRLVASSDDDARLSGGVIHGTVRRCRKRFHGWRSARSPRDGIRSADMSRSSTDARADAGNSSKTATGATR